MAQLTLLDLAARTGSDQLVGLIEDVTTSAPELQFISIVPRPGTTYKVTRRTALPTSQFRNANEGVATSKSTYVQEVKEMFFLDTQLEVDEAIVKADTRELGDVLADEAVGATRSNIIHLGSQIWYGTTADAKGFVGLVSQITDEVSASGATTACSAYLLWLDKQGVQLSVGRDGALEMAPWAKQQVVKSATTKAMAWVSNFSAYFGLSVHSANAVWRVKLIDDTHSMTDALGAQLLSKVPVARRANLRWFMNRRASYLLQKSRTSIAQQPAGSGGSPAYAPLPTECMGIPITTTDSLVDTETT